MSISDMTLAQRAALFAKLSSLAYMNKLKKVEYIPGESLGFNQNPKFYDHGGAQAYKMESKTDIVIACRGTEPTQWNDVKADLRAFPVLAETVGRVHKGFKKEVDDLWPMISEDIKKASSKKKLWVTGHSLGAAMATVVAARCTLKEGLHDVEELHTFGSPRVGWRKYCKSLPITHYRWRNNNDIVTTVPPLFMGYKHHGTSMYINAYGKVRDLTTWQRTKDKLRGIVMGLKSGRFDSFMDHLIHDYIKHLDDWAKER